MSLVIIKKNKIKFILVLFCLSVLITLPYNTFASNLEMNNNIEAIYITVFDDPVRLLKLTFNDNIIGFLEIQTFDVVEVNNPTVYHDYDIFILQTASEIIGDEFKTLNVINTEEPWVNKQYESYYLEFFYPKQIGSNNYLISLKYNETSEKYQFEPETKLINLNTGEEKQVPLNILENINYKEWFLVNGKNLFIKKMGLNHIQYPYSPPEEILKELEEIQLIKESRDYIVFRSPGYNNKTCIIIYNKNKKDWHQIIIEGEKNSVDVMNNYLISKTGYMFEGSSRINYTGGYEIINLETEERQTIVLESPGEIFLINDSCLIAKTKNRLIYIPIENTNIVQEKAQVLVDDNTNYSNIYEEIVLNRMVNLTQAVFLGPSIIPDEVKVERANELAKIGEDYSKIYNQLDKAIYYFNEALKFNPENVKAYSNLANVYLRNEEYHKSIDASLRAVDLTDNYIIKANAYNNIAKSYEGMEKWEKALEYYNKAFETRELTMYQENIDRIKRLISK